MPAECSPLRAKPSAVFAVEEFAHRLSPGLVRFAIGLALDGVLRTFRDRIDAIGGATLGH